MTIEQMIARKRELGYTNEQISELSGVPLSTVQKVFSGTTASPRRRTLLALEAVLKDHTAQKIQGDVQTPFSAPSSAQTPPSAAQTVQSDIFRVGEPLAQYDCRRPGDYTIEDYLALPDEQRVELIDGVFYDMAAPTSVHQILATEIWQKFKSYVRENHDSCVPMISPLDVQLDEDDRTIVQPDVVVICDRDKIRWERIFGAPDLVVEILSPSTRKKDMFLKLMKYQNAGVREYWIVDPDRLQIIVYDFAHDENPVIYTFDDAVPVGIWDGACRIDFSEIYEEVRFLYERNQDPQPDSSSLPAEKQQLSDPSQPQNTSRPQ